MYPDPLKYSQSDNTKVLLKHNREDQQSSVLIVKRMTHTRIFCTFEKIPSKVYSTETSDISPSYHLQNSPKHSSHQSALSVIRLYSLGGPSPLHHDVVPLENDKALVLAVEDLSTSLFFLKSS